jgi:hypothetical protein
MAAVPRIRKARKYAGSRVFFLALSTAYGTLIREQLTIKKGGANVS